MNSVKKLVSVILVLLVSFSSSAQYYYSDIVLNKIANANYALLKANKVKKINTVNNSTATEEENKTSLTQSFSNDWQTLTTETGLYAGIKSVAITTYQNDRIVKKEEEGKNVNTTITYSYDMNGRLSAINSFSNDTSVNFGFDEQHIFSYNNAGTLIKMLKVKNKRDTTLIKFITDDQGNIGEERWYRDNELVETYYYYYNEKRQLTDVVKFNLKAERMLPEFLFDYDAAGNLAQMTQIPYGSSNYFVWKYSYGPKGLKERETCFNKQGNILGTIEYTYN